MIILRVSLKGFKDKYLSLVSMTLIGDEDFGVTILFTHVYLKRPLTAPSLAGMAIFKFLPVPIRFQGQLSQKLLRVVQEFPPGKTLMQCGVQ